MKKSKIYNQVIPILGMLVGLGMLVNWLFTLNADYTHLEYNSYKYLKLEELETRAGLFYNLRLREGIADRNIPIARKECFDLDALDKVPKQDDVVEIGVYSQGLSLFASKNIMSLKINGKEYATKECIIQSLEGTSNNMLIYALILTAGMLALFLVTRANRPKA